MNGKSRTRFKWSTALMLLATVAAASCSAADGVSESGPAPANDSGSIVPASAPPPEPSTGDTETTPTSTLAPTTTEGPTLEGTDCSQEGLNRTGFDKITYICVDSQFEPYLDSDNNFVGSHPELVAKYDEAVAAREVRAGGVPTVPRVDDGTGTSGPYTVEDLNTILAPAVILWLGSDRKNNDELAAVSAAAQIMLDTGRTIPDDLAAPGTTWSALGHVSNLAGGWSWPTLYGALEALELDLPNLPELMFLGTHVVGEDVTPGRYQSVVGVDDCYWERLDASGSTIDNDFVIAAPQVQFTVGPNDFAVNNECEVMFKID